MPWAVISSGSMGEIIRMALGPKLAAYFEASLAAACPCGVARAILRCWGHGRVRPDPFSANFIRVHRRRSLNLLEVLRPWRELVPKRAKPLPTSLRREGGSGSTLARSDDWCERDDHKDG